MHQSTITPQQFLEGSVFCSLHGVRRRHDYRAKLEDGAIRVYDPAGQRVDVQFAGTADGRTLYCYLKSTGDYLGGWTFPHRRMPFSALVDYINEGILYLNSEHLPKSAKFRICPQCGHKERAR